MYLWKHLYRKAQLHLATTMFTIYFILFFKCIEKTGVGLLVVPRHVTIAMKWDSEGSAEHHKAITLLKMTITNLETGIWIVTWNKVTWNMQITPFSIQISLSPPCRDEIPEPYSLLWKGVGVSTSSIGRKLGSEEVAVFFKSFWLSWARVPAALRQFCGTQLLTAMSFAWEWKTKKKDIIIWCPVFCCEIMETKTKGWIHLTQGFT